MERTKLIAARARNHWTLAQAAERLQVDINTVYRWERGLATPRAYNLQRLCEVYEAVASELDLENRLTGKHPIVAPDGITTEAFGFMSEPQIIKAEEEARIDTENSSFPSPLPSVASENGLFIPISAHTRNVLSEAEPSDWAIRFGEITARIITMINQYYGYVQYYVKLQTILDWEITISMKPQPNDKTYTQARRQALVTLAALPLSLLDWVQTGQGTELSVEDFLRQCSVSIIACWHLLQGERLGVVEDALSAYFQTLVRLAQHPSQNQKTAAYLAAQGYLLKGILALHRVNFAAREVYCQEALHYSLISEDRNIYAATLMHLGCTFYYGKEQDVTKALHTFQKALPLLPDVSQLLRSCIHMRLAMVFAKCNKEQEALNHIRTAHEIFPEHPERDASFPYVEYGLPNLYLVQGIAYLDLDKHLLEKSYAQQAWNTFIHLRELQPTIHIPVRNHFQIINYQAKAAVALGDLEQFCHYLAQGIQGAKLLKSQMRREETIATYWQGRKAWPNDSRVKELADLFVD